MRTSITLNEMENYFKNNPCDNTSADDVSTFSLITGFQVFFEYCAPDENNDRLLQLKIRLDHDTPPENIEAIHVAAVFAAHVVGSMSELAINAEILKNEMEHCSF